MDSPSQHIRNPASIILYGLLLSSTALFFGYNIGIFNSFFKPFIEEVYNIRNPDEQEKIKANINFSFLVGGTFACLFSSFLIEALGRFRFLLLISLSIILVGFGLMIQGVTILYACRLVSGFIACASTMICPLMIKELIPQQYNAPIAGSFYIFLTGGILISNLMSEPWLTKYWMVVLAGPALLEIVKFVLYFFVYRIESPKTILAKSSAPASELQDNYLQIYDAEGARLMTDNVMNEYNTTSSGKPAITFGSLFSADYRLSFMIGLLLNFLNQATGINFLVLYSTDIFANLGMSNPAMLTSVLGFLNFLGAIYITVFGKIHKKRNLLIFGLAMQATSYFIFLAGLIFGIGWLVVSGCFLYIFSFSISLGGTLYSYLADTVPAVGISFAAITQWLLACFVGLYALDIMRKFKEFNTFYTFMVVAFVGCVLFAGYSVETEGKSDAQIQSEFRRKQFMD